MTILRTHPSLPTQRLEYPTSTANPFTRSRISATARFCFAVLNPTGRLHIHNHSNPSGNLFPLGRRTVSGLVWNIKLTGGLLCWVDADAQDGPGILNLAATQLCTQLLGDGDWPFDEPYLLGSALFTGSSGAEITSNTSDSGNTRDSGSPAGLSDRQVQLLADHHAQLQEAQRYSVPEQLFEDVDWSLW